jgi:hypothetical protein
MIRFDGNRVLLIDTDEVSAKKLMQEMIKNGAQCSLALTFLDAKKLFNIFDFDLILSSVQLPDGHLKDFIGWYQKNISDTTIFAEVSLIAPELTGICQHLDRNLPMAEFLKKTNALLFDFNEFESQMSDMSEHNGITFELSVDSKSYSVRPLEFDKESLLLGIDKPLAQGTITKLKITFHDFRRTDVFELNGVMGKQTADSQIFEIDRSFAQKWNEVMKCLGDRQSSITKFLNKVSGY